MAGFVESLPPGGPANALGSALGARHPFRAFKDVLTAFPDLREAWYAFHDREWTRLAAEWLEEEGIDATLKVRPTAADGGVPVAEEWPISPSCGNLSWMARLPECAAAPPLVSPSLPPGRQGRPHSLSPSGPSLVRPPGP